MRVEPGNIPGVGDAFLNAISMSCGPKSPPSNPEWDDKGTHLNSRVSSGVLVLVNVSIPVPAPEAEVIGEIVIAVALTIEATVVPGITFSPVTVIPTARLLVDPRPVTEVLELRVVPVKINLSLRVKTAVTVFGLGKFVGLIVMLYWLPFV